MELALTQPVAAYDVDIGALFDAHAEGLCRMVHRMTGSREVAEDVVQEVFVTAWRRRSDLTDPSHVRTWLYRVAVNHVRHRRRSKARLLSFLDRWKVEPEADSPVLPDTVVSREQRAAAIHAIVAQLSPKQREVFVLYELQELSGQEIADILEISVNTVWGRLRLARSSFRAAWEAKYGGTP